MAQTGFTPILLYSTSTASAVPSAGNLTNSTLGSELAININDGKLFYKDSGGSVQVIAWKTTPTTAGGTGLTTYTAGDLLYYATGTTLSKLGIGSNGTILKSTGTAPAWETVANLAVESISFGTTGLTPSTATKGAVTVAGTLITSNGGTGLASYSQGDLLYYNTGTTLTALAKNTSATRYLSNTGSNNNPAWAQIDLSNGVTGILPSANGGTGSAYFAISGPTALRTFTFPDANATIARTDAAQTFTGDQTLNNDLLYLGTSARQILVNRHTTSNTAGVNLTISAGGATSGATSKNGGSLILQGGIATGAGGSQILFKISPNAGPGTSDNAYRECGRIQTNGYAAFTNVDATYNTDDTNLHQFYQNDNRAALKLTNTSSAVAGAYGLQVNLTTDPNDTSSYFHRAYGNTTERFRVLSTGTVQNTTGTYGTISDQKLKQDIVDAGSQWDDVKAIRFRKYRMKFDVQQNANAPFFFGVIAQELEQTSPGLIEESKDMDEKGNDLGTSTKSVKTSVLLLKATKALQEAMQRIEQLESKMAVLEGANK